MRNEIISRLNSYLMDLKSVDDITGVLKDIIGDALCYMIDLSNNSTVKLKLGDRFVEYITSDTIGLTPYAEGTSEFTKKDAKKILDNLTLDIM